MNVLSTDFASYMLSYLLLSLTGVWITYYLMSRVFEHRHAPFVWWAYFLIKNAVNGLTIIALELGAEPWLKDVEAIELSVMSILSLLVMFYTWKGDYVKVAFCADRVAIEGHERSLARLREGEADESLARRICLLEDTYRRLSAGNYCDQPALDAVLSAGAQRLRHAGVRCEMTVAGLSSRGVDPAMAVLAMLNVAGETAERVGRKGMEQPVVDLRVGGLSEQVLLRMEVPASWGSLGVRRSLSALCREGEELIMERKRCESTVVLMLISEEAL